MANTFSQIHLQFVFAVQNRKCIISYEWKADLYKYITGINNNFGHKLIAINGVADHVHLLVGFRPSQAISEYMRIIKGESSEWVNKRRFISEKFSWQEGFGAFSYSKKEIESVICYIMNQENHHRKISFMEEYRNILKEFQIEFDERYIFKKYGNQSGLAKVK
ncbi:MAG: IS200/IS605 family transposase [Saprospiraceae bacterium]|nr:IS200/IS605 family transposase [Saprospiraceae bacterium]